jgi:hypothetical protein
LKKNKFLEIDKTKDPIEGDFQTISTNLSRARDREEFIILTNKLVDVLVDFCFLTLRALCKKKQAPLNFSQIEEAINFDFQFRIQQLMDPGLLEIIKEQVFQNLKRNKISFLEDKNPL